MRKNSLRLVLALGIVLVHLLVVPADAANRVEVESATVLPGGHATIGIYVENDDSLQALTVPLVVRYIDNGSYITTPDVVNSTPGSRFDAYDLPMSDIVVTETYGAVYDIGEDLEFPQDATDQSVTQTAGTALTGNSVVVESKIVKPGAEDVTVTVHLSNDVNLRQMSVPLVIREITPGTFPVYDDSLILSYGDRLLGSAMSEIPIIRQFGREDGHCKEGQAGGFSADTLSLDNVSPEAVFFFRGKIFGANLPAGADATGSMLITFDAPMTQGVFEIDTTCIDPSNHLEFWEDITPIQNGFTPSFTKGIIIVQNAPPVAQCKNLSAPADMNCQATAVATDIDDGSFDPDGDGITLSLNPPGPYPIGSTQVWLIVSDEIGTEDSCQATIEVVDDTPPDITCPSGDITAGSEPGECSAHVSFDLDVDDNCGVVSEVYNPASGSVFPVGTTPVRCIATDDAGNADTCDFNVVVEDTERPVVSCPADITAPAEGECNASVTFPATVDDNCAGAVVVCTRPSGSVFPVGVTTVTCIGTDAAGNADTCGFTVTVGDAAGPWTVCNLGDSGPGSLRAAIDSANASPGADSIRFAVAGTIVPQSPLPPLADQTGGTVIDGFSAPGAMESTSLIVTLTIDGSQQDSGSGLVIQSSGNRIEGLGVRRSPESGMAVLGGTGNTISRNLIYDNGALGIDLGEDGVTLNDLGDSDSGPNDFFNYPTIDSVFLVHDDSFYVAGFAPVDSRVELFLAERYLGDDTIADITEYGEAWQYFGAATTDGLGHFAFPKVGAGQWSHVTATATDLSGNTSEFARNRKLIPDSLIITVYSPVTIKVIEPDGSDSIGLTFNTIGPTASYDASTDYGIGPSGISGELDDQVVLTNIQEGDYKVIIEADESGGGGEYFCGIRVDGTEQQYASGQGAMSSLPVAIPVPEEGEEDEFAFQPNPVARGDFDGDGFLTAIDLAGMIDILFAGKPLPNPPNLADLNCDGFPDALDLALIIDHLFAGGPAPCF